MGISSRFVRRFISKGSIWSQHSPEEWGSKQALNVRAQAYRILQAGKLYLWVVSFFFLLRAGKQAAFHTHTYTVEYGSGVSRSLVPEGHMAQDRSPAPYRFSDVFSFSFSSPLLY